MKKMTNLKLESYRSAGFILCEFKRFVLVKPYNGRWFGNCYKDLLRVFKDLLIALLVLIIIPFKLVYRLLCFLPRVRVRSYDDYNRNE